MKQTTWAEVRNERRESWVSTIGNRKHFLAANFSRRLELHYEGIAKLRSGSTFYVQSSMLSPVLIFLDRPYKCSGSIEGRLNQQWDFSRRLELHYEGILCGFNFADWTRKLRTDQSWFNEMIKQLKWLKCFWNVLVQSRDDWTSNEDYWKNNSIWPL